MDIFFILGNHPNLSLAELISTLKQPWYKNYDGFAIFKSSHRYKDPMSLINQLGGTIKSGIVIKKTSISTLRDDIYKTILSKTQVPFASNQKIYFGISCYPLLKKTISTKNLGQEIKKLLKNQNISSRFVTSKEKTLSSVVVKTNKLLTHRGAEVVILALQDELYIGVTHTVQPFQEFSERDYGRSYRDPKSGMLPPKLARIMINLAELKDDAVILDPFCGSGTIIQESLVLGFKNLIGSDISKKAIDSTKSNIASLGIAHKPRLFREDVRKLDKSLAPHSIDAIITEPYLGPPLKGGETSAAIKHVINEVSELYKQSFNVFTRILKPSSKIVIVFPIIFGRRLDILPYIMNLGFIQDTKFSSLYDDSKRQSFIYGREGQRVWREVFIFKK